MSEIRIYDRVAKDYHFEVITPFSREVVFRLPVDVRAFVRRWSQDGSLSERAVIDFGCGIGEAIALVAGRVGLAAAIDFSPGMLAATRRRLDEQGCSYQAAAGLASIRKRIDRRRRDENMRLVGSETLVARANMLRLQPLARSCDLALAINSIASATVSRSYRMFEQVASCLRPQGRLIGVFPALDTFDHLLELQRRADHDDGLRQRINLQTGVYREIGAVDVKCWRPDELRQAAARRGLKVRRLEKIYYPWEMMRRYGWGYYPRARRLWDWYLDAAFEPRPGKKK